MIKIQAIQFLVILIAIEHCWVMGMEMFRWTKGFAADLAGLSPEDAGKTATLAANQGLYNGFLSAGLLWSLWLGADGLAVARFFLGCVLVAGIYGGFTASRRILLFQAAPAALGLILLWL